MHEYVLLAVGSFLLGSCFAMKTVQTNKALETAGRVTSLHTLMSTSSLGGSMAKVRLGR